MSNSLSCLSRISRKLSELSEVAAVVLYGSVARGEAGAKSDVDLLVVVTKRSRELARKIERIVEGEECGARVVHSIATPRELAENPSFVFDVLRDGIVLYKNPGVALNLPLGLKERGATIYSFDASALTQPRRTAFNRALYGSMHSKKVGGKQKRYEYKGLLARVGGERLGGGAILVSSKGEKSIEELLAFYGLPFRKTRAFVVEKS